MIGVPGRRVVVERPQRRPALAECRNSSVARSDNRTTTPPYIAYTLPRYIISQRHAVCKPRTDPRSRHTWQHTSPAPTLSSTLAPWLRPLPSLSLPVLLLKTLHQPPRPTTAAPQHRRLSPATSTSHATLR